MSCPDAQARIRIREELGVTDDELLVGLVARMDPIKDHPTFFRAAAIVSRAKSATRFVCVGGGSESYRESLLPIVEQLDLREKVIWTGLRTDMPDVYNALDVNVLSSITEGCPNVVGEAMSCGLPCVVTDAGDAANLVGDSGFISPAGDHEALAANLLSCFEADREHFEYSGVCDIR